jgi:hypothetical protein
MVMGDYVDIINELKDLVLKHLIREEFEDSFKMKEVQQFQGRRKIMVIL